MDFFKYQGTGNDFILIDIRGQAIPDLNIQQLCHRRFGIGADGLMFLQDKLGYDFEMIYYNSDGNPSSMCGNGGRCIVKFAHTLGIGKYNHLHFLAIDGPHEAQVSGDSVALGMKDVAEYETRTEGVFILNTGSPHFVKFIETEPADFDLLAYAKSIRYGSEFNAEGINVNIVQIVDENTLKMRTYERGVEDETYSCGTGVTAAALAYQLKTNLAKKEVRVFTMGGDLQVFSNKSNSGFKGVTLDGPATFVYKGRF